MPFGIDPTTFALIVAGVALGLTAQAVLVPCIASRRGRHWLKWLIGTLVWAGLVVGAFLFGLSMTAMDYFFSDLPEDAAKSAANGLQFSIVVLVVQFIPLAIVLSLSRVPPSRSVPKSHPSLDR